MKKVLFATENESKAKRFRKGLLKNNIEIITINYLLLLHIDNKLLSLLPYFMINKREYEQIDKACRL